MQNRVPEHRAIVRALADNNITVQVLPHDGARQCNGCALSAACGVSDSEEQPVFNIPWQQGLTPPAVGRVVVIRAHNNARRTAATSLFLIPATVFLACVFFCNAMGCAPWLQVVIGLLALAICYLILFLCANRRPVWQIVFVEPA